MALTLPYPGLDFVPLDVLTAAELNEVVANYTYIANQFPVASNNIDYTTLQGSVDMPIATATLETGFTGELQMKRIGNLVVVTGETSVNPYGDTGTWVTLAETMPSGFRPILDISLYGGGADSYDYAPYRLKLKTTGEQRAMFYRTGSHAYTFSGAWITQDNWPAA